MKKILKRILTKKDSQQVSVENNDFDTVNETKVSSEVKQQSFYKKSIEKKCIIEDTPKSFGTLDI